MYNLNPNVKVIAFYAFFIFGKSLFDKHPKVRETYFQSLLSGSTDMQATLEKHGTKVLGALGVMVSALKTEDDAKLLAKVSEVFLTLYMFNKMNQLNFYINSM